MARLRINPFLALAKHAQLAGQVQATDDLVAVELIDQQTGQCIYSLGGQRTYAKFVVDSIDATRRLFLRSVVDLNCGSRSLVPDEIPTN